MIINLLQVVGAILAAFLFAYTIAHICYWGNKFTTPGLAQLLTVIVWCGILYTEFHVVDNILLYSCVCFAAVCISIGMTLNINENSKKK